MLRTPTLIAAALSLPLAASGQDLLRSMVDRTRINLESSGGMSLDSADGKLEMTRYEWRQLIGDTAHWNDFSMIGLAQYRGTHAQTEGAPASYPLQNADLHLLSFQGAALHQTQGSKWLYGGWGCIELASDFEEITSDAFTFDVALGAAYRFTDRFMLGAGAGALNMNGEALFLPAIALMYRPTDEWTIGVYGPTIDATWTDHKSWKASWRGEMGGGYWSQQGPMGTTQNLEINSYQIGFHLQRRIYNQVWFAFGTGITTGNQIEIFNSDGLTQFKDKPDGGWFLYAGLRAYEW